MFSASAEVDILPVVPVPALEPAHANTSPSPENLLNQRGYGDLPRSASYTNVSGVREPPTSEGLKRTFSDDVLALKSFESTEASQSPCVPSKQVLHDKSKDGEQEINGLHFTLASDNLESPTGLDAKKPVALEVFDKPKSSGGRSMSNTFRSLARRPWKQSSSRSPSPSTRSIKPQRRSRNASPTKTQWTSFASRAEKVPPTTSSTSPQSSKLEDGEPSIPPRRPTIKQRISGHDLPGIRPLSAMIPTNRSEADSGLSRMPSLRSLGSKASSDKLSRLSMAKVPAVPSALSAERVSSASLDPNKRKDPLWGVFRTLEGDFQKFQSKSSTLKANVIRACLLPFLVKYASHPSNKTLRSEDLDRRVMILNKWWTGLLEMLNGRNNQSISGTDRPTFLDGVAGLMRRPEWRIPFFPNPRLADTPLAQRSGISASVSTTSLDSGGSDFLAESVHHNVRNTFLQNLLSQMVFVVDRMSMRSAPASLVAFCGKACAYAFFFCPGVADILVRLWRLSADTLRRVLSEFGLPWGSKLGPESAEVASHFPPAMRSLAVTSHAALVRHLRRRVPLPLGAGCVRWHGPWIGRWNGRDSDLFFAFAKHFHLLVAEILPGSFEKKLRVCVPGLVAVYAQILSFLESTLYRQTGQHPNETYNSSALDELDSPDAAATMPLTTANASRSMAENRLVMLLANLLVEDKADLQGLRALYAESFGDIVKAAARKIPIYNHDACFVLCDFFEEVLPIVSRYHHSNPDSMVLDWAFWLGVCQRMMRSENTLTEVRLIAFVYSTWNTLMADPDRRRDLCLDWLLEASFFEKFFNHWCPMVRAYYLRLLCWRVARWDGHETSELDRAVYQTLADRLDSSWASYLYLKEKAEAHGQGFPSSAPCSPAPGRRLVIIRDDNEGAPVSMFTSFDTVLSQMSSMQSRKASASRSSDAAGNNANRPAPKKKWGFIKNIIPFTVPGNSRPGEVTPPGSADSTSTTADPCVNNTLGSSFSDKSATGDFEDPGGEDHPEKQPSTPPHQSYSFKFSLEWLDGPSLPSKNRLLSRPKLPQGAEAVLQSRRAEGGVDVAAYVPRKPAPSSIGNARYCGRALAEWSQIVAEYQAFLDRRKEEGVPVDQLVETPSLGVESFRMSG